MNKQIEEMAFDIIKATSPLGVKDLTKQFDYKTVATDLYEIYGWRKQSVVAREIFAEIEQFAIHDQTLCGDLLTMSETAFAELKKKYEVTDE